jgi:hypothetical protein
MLAALCCILYSSCTCYDRILPSAAPAMLKTTACVCNCGGALVP